MGRKWCIAQQTGYLESDTGKPVRVMERESMSIKITQEQKVYINKYIENLDELLKEGEINEVLIAIDDAIISTFDKDGYPDKTGNKLQAIYDELYLTNCEW